MPGIPVPLLPRPRAPAAPGGDTSRRVPSRLVFANPGGRWRAASPQGRVSLRRPITRIARHVSGTTFNVRLPRACFEAVPVTSTFQATVTGATTFVAA